MIYRVLLVPVIQQNDSVIHVYTYSFSLWLISEYWIQFPALCNRTLLKVKVAWLCLTLCNPMDSSLPGSSVRGNLQARILEWVAIPFSRGSSQPVAGGFFTIWATKEAQEYWSGWPIPSPGDLPNPGIEPRSPALQVVSLPAELTEKPRKRLYPKTKIDIPICLEYFFP